MPDATPFDLFSECKPAGAALLREEGDDEALCSDASTPGAQIHAQLAALVAAAFERAFRASR